MRIYAEYSKKNMIERPRYLSKLISKKQNGLIKIITGNRRCGKSYLLFNIYHEYLNSIGVQDSQIIQLALDETANARYRNPVELDKYIREVTKDTLKIYYVFLDEIQKVEDIQNPFVPNSDSKISFVDTVIGLMKLKNVDLYITGSNSKMLSSDIITEFRDRGDEVRVYPFHTKSFTILLKETKTEPGVNTIPMAECLWLQQKRLQKKKANIFRICLQAPISKMYLSAIK